MSDKSGVSQGSSNAVMLSFHDHFTASPQFLRLFREGMSLVEQTADYLDGRGRAESKRLSPPASIAFTTESMKLTTRLMQLASWLLLRRALANGEITASDAINHRRRVRLAPQSQIKSAGFEALPETLRHLIEESHKLHDRIVRLDRATGDGFPGEQEASQLDRQMERIRRAFPAA